MKTHPRVSHSLLSVLVLSLMAVPGWGQITNVTDETSTPVPGLGHDYIRMLTETVDPANGSVSIRVGIPAPPGRQLSLPFAFAYDSNGAHFGQQVSTGQGGLASNKDFLNSGGWTYSVPMLTQAQGYLSAVVNGKQYKCYYETDYVFADSSGGRHALGIGTAESYPSTPDCEQTGPPASKGYAGDDFVRALTSTAHNDRPPPVTVSDADGTVYQFNSPGAHSVAGSPVTSAFPTFIEDRNGNQITVMDSGNGAFTFTDTLGRALMTSTGFGSTGNRLTVSGLSAYSVTWGTVSTNFVINSVQVYSTGNCRGMGGDDETLSVIRSIALPNGQSYQFVYDSDDPSLYDVPGEGPFGLVSKIIYPSGGYVRYT